MAWEGLGEPAHMNLINACILVEQSFNETPFLVGSAAVSRDFRNVDIRVIMNDEKYNVLFGPEKACRPFWNLVCVSISSYLRQATGLPVDFQIQRRSDVLKDDWDKVRWPLSLYLGKEYFPEWAKERGS